MPKLKGDLLIDEPRSPDGTEPRAFEDTNTVIDLYLQAPAWKDELPEAEVLARRAALAALSTAEPALPRSSGIPRRRRNRVLSGSQNRDFFFPE